MPRPKKIKSPEDFGKKPRKPEKKEPLIHEGFGVPMKEVNEKFAESHEPKELTPLEELQKLEKKLRACTTETPRDIKYEFFGNEVVLHLAYNNIEVDASIPTTSRYYRLKTAKPYLATAQKMLEVLKEWRGE